MNFYTKTIHSDWLRPITNHSSSELQLICFPHAGGSIGAFRSWAQFIPSFIDLIGVQYPGREDRIYDKPISDIKNLASEISTTIQKQKYSHIALFGHSMGATIAYEVACMLQKNGVFIEHLFISGQTAPTKTRKTMFHCSTDEALMREVIRVSETSGEVFENQELREIILSIIRNDYKAIETYSTETPTLLSMPITILVGDNDTEATYQEALDWSAYTKHKLDIYSFKGKHFFINTRFKEIIELITSKLSLFDHSYGNSFP
ncbi:Surfactin synthase thioesterase subunit (GrsT) (PDB:6VAP) [Commensalibacter communis]|uniref:Surfactin synthase thioesterase subunit (GrsT) n=1 Tax=Commensalibacter communis TaxID=2972786 RepID=A0A9W4TP20_9PROT|nr:thioesterase domain-containing protein [Commensalibacter communis]CAI3955487.1 Surfactin synthase thioesterase subunit (GrsT) (PDB:6VAP) [Commensalibacter communis]CAI3957664.1 Surfactin synthase thioesterase subunit (GrsT) (PDB:6VAP) [Commensalibacter communis]CAI3958180.1 Surfactin synthase thioesterase subunit (GrsT) (PDB:6VAP) [Commensalibacter communis]CAI3959375.1 Surfactin synthase thioesterase subunit (GrsT) (PDB:6VAP) [Commensalibacter communis]